MCAVYARIVVRRFSYNASVEEVDGALGTVGKAGVVGDHADDDWFDAEDLINDHTEDAILRARIETNYLIEIAVKEKIANRLQRPNPPTASRRMATTNRAQSATGSS